MRPIALCTLWLAWSPAHAAPQATAARRDSLTITYLANEGLMLSAGGTKVLIDALFGDGLRGYGVVTPARRETLERAQAPFNDVDAILATHSHGDHFDARAVARHLIASSRPVFVSTDDAVDALRKAAPDDMRRIAGRLVPVVVDPGARRQVASAGGATIWALGLPHGPGSPANLGFVVEIGGRRVLHVGDSDAGVDEFAALRQPELGIDVALLTMGYLTNADRRAMVRRHIGPGAIAVIHVPPRTSRYWGPAEEERLAVIAREFPGVRVFREELETLVVRSP